MTAWWDRGEGVRGGGSTRARPCRAARLLLSGSANHTLKKVCGEAPLSVRNGAGSDACAATLQGHTHYVVALAVVPDRRVVSGSCDGTLRVWQ